MKPEYQVGPKAFENFERFARVAPGLTFFYVDRVVYIPAGGGVPSSNDAACAAESGAGERSAPFMMAK